MNIWYIQPYSLEKNLGKAINDQISQLPKDSWICLLDHDVMFLRPDTKEQIHHIVSKGEFELYGCFTNRLALEWQTPYPELFNCSDILAHVQVANLHHELAYGQAQPIEQPLGGFLLVFNKSTWENNKFKENTHRHDIIFSKKVKSKAIMTGVYVYHLYRVEQDNPKHYIDHLKNGSRNSN